MPKLKFDKKIKDHDCEIIHENEKHFTAVKGTDYTKEEMEKTVGKKGRIVNWRESDD